MAPDRGVDLLAFKERYQNSLIKVFQDIPGKKDVVFEKALVGPVEMLVPFVKLKELGVDRPFYLENDNTVTSQESIVFIASGEKPQKAQAVADQIKRLRQTSQTDHDFYVCWLPRRTLLANKILEDAGVLGEVNSIELPIHFQVLEPDLFSLELDNAFGDLFLAKDPTSIFSSAKALMQLQQRYGLFPRIIGKGDHARRLAELLVKMRSELQTLEPSNAISGIANLPSQTFDRLIIIDRQSDLATPLMTQLTYEGLIDEVFHISHGKVELDLSIAGGAAGASKTRPVKLDNADTLFSSIREAHFTAVGGLLNQTARRLQSVSTTDRSAMSISEIRAFIPKIQGYQGETAALKLHTNILDALLKHTQSSSFRDILRMQQNLIAGADYSVDELDDLISQDAPLEVVLRLLCLTSLVSGGLRPRDLDALRAAVLRAHGHAHLLTLDALTKMGLLTSRAQGLPSLSLSTFGIAAGAADISLPDAPAATVSQLAGAKPGPPATDYSAARRALHLILDDVDEEQPADPAFAYSGYAPLAIRLVQAVIQKDALASLSGPSAIPGASGLGAVASRIPGAGAIGIGGGGGGGGGGSTGSGSGTATPSNRPGTATAPPKGSSQGAAWRPHEAALSSVAGATFDVAQGAGSREGRAREVLAGRAPQGNRPRATLVFFLGGVTYAELAGLRLVGRQVEGECRLVVGTTGLVGGRDVVDAAVARSRVEREA